MKLLIRLIFATVLASTAGVNAAQEDSDELRRRLTEIEAEQAKNTEMIKELRLLLEAAKNKANKVSPPDRKAVTRSEVSSIVKKELSSAKPARSTKSEIFSELAHESIFLFTSKDDRFSLGIDGTIIGRYEINRRKDDGSGSSDTDQGFQMTGTRLNFKGKLYDDFGYWARFNADKHGDPSLDAILATYSINKNTTLVVGQFPSVLIREQAIPADKLQVQESSPTNYTFDPFGYKGIMIAYHTPKMVFRGVINDGYGSASNSAFDGPSAKWAFAGQVLRLAAGNETSWGQFDNFTSRPGSDYAWLLNASFHVQEGDTHGNSEEASDDLFLGVLESSWEGDGWNLYTSGYYRHTESITSDFEVDDSGFVILGGMWVAKHFEIYSRYDITIPDSDRPTEGDKFRTLTAGLNFYPIAHTDNIKIGFETLYMFDPQSNSIVQPNVFNSVRESPAGDQIVFRTQAVIQW